MLIYILLSDYDKALSYLYRADSTVNAVGGTAKKELENGIFTNLGETYYKMKNTDSAKHYFSAALKLGIDNGNSSLLKKPSLRAISKASLAYLSAESGFAVF